MCRPLAVQSQFRYSGFNQPVCVGRLRGIASTGLIPRKERSAMGLLDDLKDKAMDLIDHDSDDDQGDESSDSNDPEDADPIDDATAVGID